MKVHIIGIGGTAAAYLVDIAINNGYVVTGSDSSSTNDFHKLENMGIRIFNSHRAENVSKDINEIWYSAAITNSSSGYIEIEAAKRFDVPCLSFAQVAARFFNRANIRIAVAGTHGKSTTTAMMGWVLEKAGLNPTVALGAKLGEWGGNSRLGDESIFVIEADEYARRFLEYNPTHAIITSVEQDHFDTYPTALEYENAFKKLVNLTTHALVINYQYPMSHNIIKGFDGTLIKYTEPLAGITLHMPGKHNLLNATAVYEMASILGVPHAIIIDALKSFPGIERRFEYIGSVGETKIYDDYGHHASELRATLEATKETFPDMKLILIYQPHQAGRLRHQMDETVSALDIADKVILLPVYKVPGRESDEDVEVATSEELMYRAVKLGQDVELAQSNEEAANKVRNYLKSRTLILTMGATDVYKVGQLLLK
jgi:UDP-N-acetylmuramate--alanine ligase